MSKTTQTQQPLALFLTVDHQIDRRTLQEADCFESMGWRVEILAIPVGEDVSFKDDPRVVRMHSQDIQGKSRAVLKIYSWLRRCLTMNGAVMKLLKRFAWRFVVNHEGFYLDVFSASSLRYQPQVVVAVDLPMLSAAVQLADKSGAKLIYDSHELFCEQEFPSRLKRFWKATEDKYIRRCDTVITVNPSIAEELKSRYQLRDVKVIYNAERCTFLPTKSQVLHQVFDLPSKIKIILFQGGLIAGRNLKTIIAAMGLVKNPDIHLVVLGDGQLRRHLEAQAASLGITSKVHFHDAVPQNQLLAYTQGADVGLIPYQPTCLNNYYCTPNKLFEFIAAGVPILGSDLPEIANIVKGHQIGLVGDTATPSHLAAAMDDFFSDTERLQGFRENVLSARKAISWEQEGIKFQEIVRETCMAPA